MGAQAIFDHKPFVGFTLSVATFNYIVDMKDVVDMSIHSILTGTPTGTWVFARSNSPNCDPTAVGQATAAASTDWVTFAPTGAPANPAGAAQNNIFELLPEGARWLKVALTISGGAGTYSLLVFGKGQG